jgi:hypothetical protein
MRYQYPIRCDGCLDRGTFAVRLASRSSTPDCQVESRWLIGQSFFCITYNKHCGLSVVILVMCETNMRV